MATNKQLKLQMYLKQKKVQNLSGKIKNPKKKKKNGMRKERKDQKLRLMMWKKSKM